MSLEIACTACGAELEVESGGAVTQCPACGINLEIPDFEESAAGEPHGKGGNIFAVPTDAADSTDLGSVPDTTSPSTDVTSHQPEPGAIPSEKSSTQFADDEPSSDFSAFDTFQSRSGQDHGEASPPEFGTNARPTAQSTFGDAIPMRAIGESMAATSDLAEETGDENGLSPIFATTSVTNATAPAASSNAVTDSELAKLKSRNKLLLSYASAVTLAALWMAYMLYTSAFAKYRLESLPDLAPPVDKNGKLSTLIYVPSTARLPPLHELRIGESRQFGVVRVTPLRVTRGPLQFVRYDGNPAEKREPSGETLQLHLRLENMSRDQVVTPLDSALVYARQADSKHVGRILANQFIQHWHSSPTATNPAVDPVVLYDLPIGSIWDIAGQNLGRALEPGEAVETFVASSEEGLNELQGDLQWRLHFRKGHNTDSGRGVTTLVDIRFQAQEIQPSG